MSFTAKVRSTGQLFWVATEEGPTRDAHLLEPGKQYAGHLFDAVRTQPDRVEYTETKWATFAADDLEDWPGDIRLVHIPKRSA